jgi:hypothetical protein
VVIPKFKNKPACEGTDTDMWFPYKQGEYKEQQLLFRICNGCLAKAECLEYALEYNVDGYWAGTTDRHRKLIRRQRRQIAKPLLPEWELNRRGA